MVHDIPTFVTGYFWQWPKGFVNLSFIPRYETESAGKIDELEHAKMKLQARLAEAEETIEGLNTR